MNREREPLAPAEEQAEASRSGGVGIAEVRASHSLPARVLALQRLAGNAAVARLVQADGRPSAGAAGSAPTAAVATRRLARAPLCGTGVTRTCATGPPCETADSSGAPDPSGKWQLTVAIDIETEKAEDVKAATVGHTYLEFRGADGRSWTYGFYPNPTTPVTEFKWEVFGCMVHPDSIHAPCVDLRETFTVTQAQYQDALKLAQDMCKATPHYHIRDFNCTTFAKLIVEKAGQKLPETKGKVGGSVGLTTDNPNTLYDSIKARDVPTYKLTGDAEMRQWLHDHTYDDINKLPEAEKLRLINRLLDGWVSDDDLQAVEWVCLGVRDSAQMDRIEKAIRPRVSELNARQGKRLGDILANRNFK